MLSISWVIFWRTWGIRKRSWGRGINKWSCCFRWYLHREQVLSISWVIFWRTWGIRKRAGDGASTSGVGVSVGTCIRSRC
jgi:hypothetical protein